MGMANRTSHITVVLITLALVLMPLRSIAMGMAMITADDATTTTMEMAMSDGGHHHDCTPEQPAIDHHGCSNNHCSGSCCAPLMTTSALTFQPPTPDRVTGNIFHACFENIPPIELRPPRTLTYIAS
jgi:hypothetical protein